MVTPDVLVLHLELLVSEPAHPTSSSREARAGATDVQGSRTEMSVEETRTGRSIFLAGLDGIVKGEIEVLVGKWGKQEEDQETRYISIMWC